VTKLTDKERAALLRAVRVRIQQLTDRLETDREHARRGFPGAKVVLEIQTEELKLLANAVRKLWTGSLGL